MIGLTQAARAAVLGVALAGAATPAFAAFWNGQQFVVDFEEFAPGVTAIHYDGIDTFIQGGIVSDDSGFTPNSGANVYLGTEITTKQSANGSGSSGIDLWPALGAYISPGSATVFVTFYGWSPDLQALVAMETRQTSGLGANQFISFASPPATDLSLVSMAFISAGEFALDDLLFGDPDIMPGVPEPGTWTLMILGFGATGAALRRRRRAATA